MTFLSGVVRIQISSGGHFEFANMAALFQVPHKNKVHIWNPWHEKPRKGVSTHNCITFRSGAIKNFNF